MGVIKIIGNGYEVFPVQFIAGHIMPNELPVIHVPPANRPLVSLSANLRCKLRICDGNRHPVLQYWATQPAKPFDSHRHSIHIHGCF